MAQTGFSNPQASLIELRETVPPMIETNWWLRIDLKPMGTEDMTVAGAWVKGPFYAALGVALVPLVHCATRCHVLRR